MGAVPLAIVHSVVGVIMTEIFPSPSVYSLLTTIVTPSVVFRGRI